MRFLYRFPSPSKVVSGTPWSGWIRTTIRTTKRRLITRWVRCPDALLRAWRSRGRAQGTDMSHVWSVNACGRMVMYVVEYCKSKCGKAAQTWWDGGWVLCEESTSCLKFVKKKSWGRVGRRPGQYFFARAFTCGVFEVLWIVIPRVDCVWNNLLFVFIFLFCFLIVCLFEFRNFRV